MWQPKSVRVIVIPVAALAVGLALCAATLVIALGVRPAAAGPNANPGAPNPGHAWTEIEGHGIDSAGWWLGTIASNALELRVNGVRALRLEPNATSPNVIAGYSGNSVTAGAVGAAIGGGGASGNSNSVTDDYGTVGGGEKNQAGDNAGTTTDHNYDTVGGGYGNQASGSDATVGGGGSNISSSLASTVGGGVSNISSSIVSTVGGGSSNTASGGASTVGGGISNAAGNLATVGGGQSNTASGDYATIAGGGRSDPNNASTGNRVTDNYGTVGGGGNNQAGDADGNSTNSPYATVGGGYANTAYNYGTAGGGWSNTASGGGSTVGGGESNTATDTDATVGGGADNHATRYDATVGGGVGNLAQHPYATVGGGNTNTAAGYDATVPGGYHNVAGGDYSFAAGYNANANASGSFVWADSTGAVLTSNYANQFLARASGGTFFYSNAAAANGVALYANDSGWSSFSSRDVKDNFTPVDGQEVLASLANVPLSTWNYKAQDPSIRHMGPMAQDFSAAFGLGEDNLHINTVDADGVALAGIQGLYQLSQEQGARIQALEAQVTALEGANGTSNSASAGLFSSGLSIGWLPIGGLFVAGLVLVQRRRTGGKR